jgi:hypothetical protein
MRIGKSKVMAGTGVRKFQYEVFVNPPTWDWRNDLRKRCIDGTSVGFVCTEKWNIWEPRIHEENKG